MVDQREYGPGDLMKILLVADERFHGEVLLEEIQSHIKGKSTEVEVLVIAPALADSVLEDELGGIDQATPGARKRLDWLVGELNRVGIKALGEIGDQDPAVAIGDGLREFPADEVVIVSHAGRERSPAEKDLWRKAEQDYTQPLVEISVETPDGGVGEVVSERTVPARSMTESERIRETSNLPPFSGRDIFGILVAFLGTITLGLLAVESAISEDDSIGKVTAGILLIAIPSFLINASYLTGTLIFSSVNYNGPWRTLLRRVSLIWTLGGIAAAILIWVLL
jgi:hypothetical protein